MMGRITMAEIRADAVGALGRRNWGGRGWADATGADAAVPNMALEDATGVDTTERNSRADASGRARLGWTQLVQT